VNFSPSGSNPTVDTLALIFSGLGVLFSAVVLGFLLYDRKPHPKIECGVFRTGSLPDVWLLENREQPTPDSPVVAFRVTNTGKPVQLSDVHIALEDGTKTRTFQPHHFSAPMLLQSPRAYWFDTKGFAGYLVGEGCKGTCRVKLVLVADSGDIYDKECEVPNVEALARGADPVAQEPERLPWWRRLF
jgi:hypothetical protein